MRLLLTLPILGRTPPCVRRGVRPILLSLALVRNGSRLSGIHHGLRRSERASPQGAKAAPKLEIREPPGQRKPYLTPAERRRARVVARHNPVTFKIKKGKKNITEPAGPGRIRTARRYSDPRDFLGAGSLLKKFKTGQLAQELREESETKSDHLQHDDFARKILADEIDELANSRKHPSSRGRNKTKSQYEKLRADQALPRYGKDDWGRARSAGAEGSFGRDRRVRDTSYEGDASTPDPSPSGRNTPADAGRFDRLDRPIPEREVDVGGSGLDEDLPRETMTTNRVDKLDGLNRRELSQGGSGQDRSSGVEHGQVRLRPRAHDQWSDGVLRLDREPSRRVDEAPSSKSSIMKTWNDAAGEGGGEEQEKPKGKRFQAPPSIIYTTAASQFLYGTSTVEAALTTSRRKLYKLYIYQGGNRMRHEKDNHLARTASKKDVPVEWVGEEKLPMLNRMSSNRPHNGHVLEASPLPQLTVNALGDVSSEQSWPGFKVELGYQSAEDSVISGTSDFIMTEPSTHKPFVLLLDEIVDPQNVGAIIRTASFMGVSAVVLSKRGSAPITPVVLKASSGAAETMTMLSVESPAAFVTQSSSNGWRIFAAVPPKSNASRRQMDMWDIERRDPLLQDPCILVLGSEGHGLSPQLRKCPHTEVTIANMSGSTVVDSLNVGVATGLLCSAFHRGRSRAQDSGIADAGALF